MTDEGNPHPRDEPVNIELDPPTEYVLITLLDRALQDDLLDAEPHEKAALGRLMSSLEGHGKPKGELTEGVKENTILDGLPGHIYQEKLFEYYDEETKESFQRHCPRCDYRFDLGSDGDLNCPKCGIESHPTSGCERRDCTTA